MGTVKLNGVEYYDAVRREYQGRPYVIQWAYTGDGVTATVYDDEGREISFACGDSQRRAIRVAWEKCVSRHGYPRED